MSELENTLEALRNIDVAINNETDEERLSVLRQDAEKLAEIALKLSEQPDIPSGPSGAAPFIARGMAELPGLVIDAVAKGSDYGGTAHTEGQPSGREIVESGLRKVGIMVPEVDREPETPMEYVGQAVGEATSLLIPTTAALKGIGKGAEVARKVAVPMRGIGGSAEIAGAGTAARVANSIYQSMVKHPFVTMTAETTGAAGAGIGRYVGEESFPDSPFGRTTAEIVGGIAGAAVPTFAVNTPTMTAIRAGKAVLHRVAMPFTKPGVKFRAGKFLKGEVVDPDKVSARLGEQTISDLPPSIQTREKRIVQLYKSLLAQDPVADSRAVESISKAIIHLESEARRLGYGSPEILADITRRRIAALQMKADKRILEATQRAEQRLSAIPVADRRTSESIIVRNELENAMRKEKVDVDKLWGEVPKDIEVGFENTREAYRLILDDLSQAQKVDIPEALKTNKITSPKKVKQKAGFFGVIEKKAPEPTTTTLREMQGLRSKLLEAARIARKDGKWNKARIADDVADAILMDLDNAPGGEALRTAISATRHFKSRFESGVVGKILWYEKSGAPAIDPSLTLDISIGRMGQKGAVDLRKVVVTPEAEAAAKRYLARSYTDYALKNGKINPINSEKWIKSNEAILDGFPDLRAQLVDAEEAERLAIRTRTLMDKRLAGIKDPKISSAAKFINSVDMNRTFDDLFKHRNPLEYADHISRMAARDVSGDAINGVRSGLVDYILKKSTTGGYNELGERTISGLSVLDFMKRNGPVLSKIFNREQIGRLRQVGKELSMIEAFEKAGVSKVDIRMKDFASSAIRFFARVGGARLGGWMGQESMGGSLVMAQAYSGKARQFVTMLTKDRSEQLVKDAIMSDDPALFKALMLPLDKPSYKINVRNLLVLNKQLNLWLAGTGKRIMEDIMDDITEEEKTNLED